MEVTKQDVIKVIRYYGTVVKKTNKGLVEVRDYDKEAETLMKFFNLTKKEGAWKK